MDVQNVTVIGAGNGGITAAADLTDRGFTVTLYESPEFSGNLEGIRKRRGIVLDDGMDEKFIEFTDVTTNIEKAVRDADIIMRSEEHTSELQSRFDLVCRLLLEQKK